MANTPFALRPCRDDEADTVADVINDGASAYRGVIPADRWKEPYMTGEEVRHEVAAGVRFWGAESTGTLVGVMGIQDVKDVTLIRHAYVRTAWRRHGVGTALLLHLRRMARHPVLIGTWADATWAVRFYAKHGFGLITGQEKDRLLTTYWTLHPRHVETSVVMADPAWLARRPGGTA
jgi:GNAT superfamily N-acetyltransferase